MDASHDVIAVSSMAGVGRGSFVTNRRRSGRESSASLTGMYRIGQDTQDNNGVTRICRMHPPLILPLSCLSCEFPSFTGQAPVGAVREPPTTRPLQRLRDAVINKDRQDAQDAPPILAHPAYPVYPCEFLGARGRFTNRPYAD